MNETSRIETATKTAGSTPAPHTVDSTSATEPIPEAPKNRGLAFYARGGLIFFKKMWPALYDLSTTEAYVSASAIAFNVILSFFSFAVLIGSLLLNVMRWQLGYDTSIRLMESLLPSDSKVLIQSLKTVTHGPGGKATFISFALMMYSACGIFQPIEAALNRAWGFKERGVVKQYATYLGMVVVCILIMLAVVSLGGLYDILISQVTGLFGMVDSDKAKKYIFYILSPVIMLPFAILLLFVIYYFIPNGKVDATQTLFTSIAIALLLLIALFGYRLALPLFDFKRNYSVTLAPLMALVTFVFVSSFILILGANLSTRKLMPQSWTGYLPFKRNAATMVVDAQRRS